MTRGVSKWLQLQDNLMNATEKECEEMLAKELQTTPVRVQYRLRILGRLNKLRAEREREAVLKGQAPFVIVRRK